MPGPHRVIPCVFQCPRISPQDRPRFPQDAKVETPSMSNNTHGHQNPRKICKNQGLDLNSKIPLLCSPVSQNRPRFRQDAEVRPPILPNEKFASQKYQDPLGTMPRICNPEAMSNDRGASSRGRSPLDSLHNLFSQH